MIGPLAPAPAGRVTAGWIRPRIQTCIVGTLQTALKLERPAAAVLAARGYTDPASASEFLCPQLASLHDPFSMRDMDKAVARIEAAIRCGEPILLYGDYDVDGACSIVVLKRAIEILGGRAAFHIPHRLKDGYGIHLEPIDSAAAAGIRLIVSADTGIRARAAVQRAKHLGIDIIVTDHHLPDAELPPAFAILNPNRPGCGYPNKHLCGAGVAFKLVHALFLHLIPDHSRRRALLDSFLKLVAIATIADIVPLTGENRLLAHAGLSGLRSVRNPGLKSLLRVSGFEEGECPSAGQVAFRLAPRMNAAGRIANARDVVELLLTDDLQRAQALAAQLDTLNRERQQVEARIVEEILRQCEQSAAVPSSALVFSGSGWHLGVLGIVAGRLAERFYRPVFVLSDALAPENGEPLLSGSGRSIPSFHLLEALESMPDLFTRFGGHCQAAGVTLPAASLPEFRRRFQAYASARLGAAPPVRSYTIDAEVPFPELTERAISELMNLGPFGFGNPAPLLYAEDGEIAGPPKDLKNGKHFTVPLRHQSRMLFAKAWNFEERAALLAPGSRVDLLYQIEDDPFSRKRGYGSWCLSLTAIRPRN
jgi:single-stranded-DNA-specific exonuclease